MKKILILVITISFLMMVGCSSSKPDSTSEENTKIVYCDNCGEESSEVSKFCPSCGEEAKWVSEKPQVKAETNTKQEESSNKKTVKSRKNEYKQKLLQVEEGMSDLDYLYENGVTSELVEAEGTRYGRWDDMLNEIYGVLKTQISSSEMEALKSEQYKWVDYRDNSANDTAMEEGGGGSMSGIIYNSCLAEITKERCYELVNNYMK